MILPLAFVGAAALGAVMRWQAGRLLPAPLGTLCVNVIGAFALGLLNGIDHPAMVIMGVGGLGAFTTFSAFAAELRDLLARSVARAMAYLAATIAAGLPAATLGLWLST